jgi:hypothetical protein
MCSLEGVRASIELSKKGLKRVGYEIDYLFVLE